MYKISYNILKRGVRKSCNEMLGWPWTIVEKTILWQGSDLIPHCLCEDFYPHVRGLEAAHVSKQVNRWRRYPNSGHLSQGG